jgi:hypothetical protein
LQRARDGDHISLALAGTFTLSPLGAQLVAMASGAAVHDLEGFGFREDPESFEITLSRLVPPW